MKIGWTPKSIRTFKKLVRKNPQLRPLIEATLELLSEDCFNPSSQDTAVPFPYN